MNKKNILIIGASGSLGQGICQEIKFLYNITGTYNTNEPNITDVNFIHLDITDNNNFSILERDYDAVILIAGAMPATMKGYDPYKYIDVNITGTLNVLEFCRINNIKN